MFDMAAKAGASSVKSKPPVKPTAAQAVTQVAPANPPAHPPNRESSLSEYGSRPAHWEEDDKRSECAQCEAAFTFLRRKHHCRACGVLVSCTWFIETRYCDACLPEGTQIGVQ